METTGKFYDLAAWAAKTTLTLKASHAHLWIAVWKLTVT